MSAPLGLRSNFSDLFSSTALPALEERFRHRLEMHPSVRERIFDVKRTSRDIWQASESTDLQNFVQIPEGTDYPLVRNRQGANKTLVPLKYGLGFSISEEMVEDAKFDAIGELVEAVADSAVDSREQSGIAIFDGAFGATNAWDGLDLCHTAHTLPSGLTFRNKPSTDADLSRSALQSAIGDFRTQFIRDSGKIANLMPKVLFVHDSNRMYAKELLGSSQKPDSMDNNMNSLQDEGLIVISTPRLADTDAWFLLAEPSKTGLKIIERKGIETKAAGPDAGFINDSIIYKSRYREIVGVTHAYGIWGSSGG